MSKLDTACVFIKELIHTFQLPCEMHCYVNGDVTISIGVAHFTDDKEEKVTDAAERLGFRVENNGHWLTCYG